MSVRPIPSPPAVPSLEDLARDPTRAAEIPLEAIPQMLIRLGMLHAVETVLAARLAAGLRKVPTTREPAGEEYLTVAQAAAALQVKPRWVYEHLDEIPGAQRLSRKCVRIPGSGVRRLLARKGVTPLRYRDTIVS